MARRRYYRRSARVMYPKKKWATNMATGLLTMSMTAGSGYTSNILVANSSQTSTPTPVIIKAGNFKVQGDCYITGGNPVGAGCTITVYVLYVPQIVASNPDVLGIVRDHPEWIMGWKLIDLASGATSSSGAAFSVSSRLKRNLNSGDAIVLGAVAIDGTSSHSYSITIGYTTQWWTSSN